jgi:class 3 adenylate cyclase
MPDQEEKAVLFSDIRDFTSLTADRGDHEAYRLVKVFVNLVEEEVKNQRGSVIKTYGDGVMNTFPDVESGLRASIEMQRSLQEHNEASPEDTISAGIGLNWGEILRDNDDIFGHSVNVAARLANSAKGGQILVSSSAREKSKTTEDFEFVNPEHLNLKGIGDEEASELLWQDEVGRLAAKDDQLILILTDDHLSIELSKSLQEEINEAREELSREAEKHSGLTKFLLEKVESYVDRYLPKVLDWGLTKKGIGLEHSLREAQLDLKNDGIVFSLKGEEVLTLSKDEIDLPAAKEFATKFKKLKSS